MRRNWITAMGVLAAMGIAPLARAADHADGPAVQVDSTTDITDVFAWMSGDNSKVYLVMDVAPNASNMTKFSNTAKYVFHLKTNAKYGDALARTPGVDINTVVCTFDMAGKISCWVNDKAGKTQDYVNGDASMVAGLASASGKVKVFAGLRDDPFFFNLGGFKDIAAFVKMNAMGLTFDIAGCPTIDNATSMAAIKILSHSGNGANAPIDHFGAKTDGLSGNIMSIVVVLDKTLVTSAMNPILGVWASTNK